MDPNETLAAALRALAAGDYEGALDYLIYYREWRERGGFEPPFGDKRAALLNDLRGLGAAQIVEG